MLWWLWNSRQQSERPVEPLGNKFFPSRCECSAPTSRPDNRQTTRITGSEVAAGGIAQHPVVGDLVEGEEQKPMSMLSIIGRSPVIAAPTAMPVKLFSAMRLNAEFPPYFVFLVIPGVRAVRAALRPHRESKLFEPTRHFFINGCTR